MRRLRRRAYLVARVGLRVGTAELSRVLTASYDVPNRRVLNLASQSDSGLSMPELRVFWIDVQAVFGVIDVGGSWR